MKIKRGASPRPIENYLTLNPKGVNWIKIGDAPRFGKYIISTKEKITYSGAQRSVKVFPGDFILSNSMSFGRPYILAIDGCIHDGWLRLFDFQDADDEFLFYLLSSDFVQKQYKSFAAGSGVQNLNKEVVKKVEVFLPSVPEQKRIAQFLSSFDTYIDDLSLLIEKKKNIRDGALEELMSGKRRLNGFKKSWIKYPFEEYFSFVSTNTFSREQLSERGKIGDIHYGDRVEVSFPDLYGNQGVRQLQFDFAVYGEDCTIKALIECQGEQHFRPVEEFGGRTQYKQQQKNDELKREYANKHNIPLIEISYKDKKYEKVKKILEENQII